VTPERRAALARVVDALPDLDRPLLVVVDGGDGAGKTWFADDLAELLVEAGRLAVRASIDDFHHPRAHRHELGRTGGTVWARSFDYRALRRELLDPWRTGAGSPYRRRSHDLASDALVDDPVSTVPEHGVLVVDGVFAQRDELRDSWDLVVWLEVADEVRIRRVAARGGFSAEVSDPDQQRYLEAQSIYRATADPVGCADLVVDNTDADRPLVVGTASRPRPVATDVMVRAFEPDDQGSVTDLAARLVAGVAPWRAPSAVSSAVTGWVRDAIDERDADHPMWVAVVGGRVVGFAAGGVSTHWAGDEDAYVGELVVAPEHEGRGIGDRLLRRFEEWARDRGLRRIRVETGAANQSALSFYENRGYVLEDVTLSKPL
jgi:uridine kinase